MIGYSTSFSKSNVINIERRDRLSYLITSVCVWVTPQSVRVPVERLEPVRRSAASGAWL